MKVAIIYGHPLSESLCQSLGDQYAAGALDQGAQVRKIELSKMEFNAVLNFGYKKRMVEEPDLVWAKESIVWADHLVFVYPLWWGGMPSLLKGFVDRVFTPGFAFKYIEGSYFNEKLLKGKSARVIVTSDSPKWYVMLKWRNNAKIQMKTIVLNYCGISPVKYSHIGSVKWHKPSQLKNWLEKSFKWGVSLS